MKVDTSRLKKGTSEVPIECQQLIDRLSTCSRPELIAELSKIDSWTFGKCELYHWITILDKFDRILEEATQSDNDDNEWSLKCDTNFSPEDVKLLLLVLNFTTLLIEHSFSRHLYNSIEHLTKLLSSSNMNIVLGVLNLLYMFSKRSNFISRLTNNKKNSLLARLNFFAESWGGKEYGFSLAACCEKTKLPETASTLFYEFYTNNGTSKTIEYEDITINFGTNKNVDDLARKIFLNHKVDLKNLDEDQKMHILIRVRRAWAFRKHSERLHFVQARLQALSVLIYSNSVQENIHQLLYPGFLEELVELMGLTSPHLVEIKAAALRTLTSIIHLDRNPHFPKKPGSRLAMIIDVTGASSYHGFLPTLVRTCINSLTSFNSTIGGQFQQLRLNQNYSNNNGTFYLKNYSLEHNFPLPLATALFSFLYHLASYESGGEALVSCGMMESLLRIINWNGYELEHITFVTRAVRVIDLITNIEMNSFQNYGGLESFINRLDLEVNCCRQEQPFEIEPQHHTNSVGDVNDFTGLFSNSNSSNDSNSDQISRSSLTTTFSNILRPSDLETNGLRSRERNQATRILQSLNSNNSTNNTRVNVTNDVIVIDDSTTEDSHSPIHRLTQQDQQQSQQEQQHQQREDPQRVGQYQRVRCIPGINSNASTLVCEIINDFNSIIDDQSNSDNKTSIAARLSAKTCLPQRAALLKSMLNFLKKAIQDQAFSDSIRHLMEGTLPSSLRHIISNAEYYGPSLFLLATDVVTVYVFQEPSLLSSLQDNGLTDVVLQALLKKDVPATREVLGSLPNVFSALCLNSRGLHAFVKYAPFERLYKVLLSPVYLLAMRRRRSNEPMGDTASNLGNAMDELMRHQPSLKAEATKAIIKLLNELVHLGTDPKYICWRPNNKNDSQSMSFSNIQLTSINQPSSIVSNGVNNSGNNNSATSILRQQQQQQNHRPSNNNSGGGLGVNSNTNEADMSDGDDDDDDEEEASTSSHHNQRDERPDSVSNQSSVVTSHSIGNNIHSAQSIIMNQTNSDDAMITDDNCSGEQRELIPLIDYILNAMKFIDAILSNNSTDDHCREFVQHGGLQPLLSILALPNLPVDSPATTSAQAVAAVCKSILNLSHESEVLQVALNQLSIIVEKLKPLQVHIENPGGSVLLRELANCPNVDAAFSNASYTPLLHAMSAVHGYIVMLVHICRTGQSEIRTILLEKWGQKNELLTNLVQLYTALVWESTLLLALCTDDVFPSECEFGKEDIEKLPNENLNGSNNQGFSNILNNQRRLEDEDDDCVIVEDNKNIQQTMDCDQSSSTTNNIEKNETSTPHAPGKKKLIASPGQLRYIKALLGASSRLGRALAELFGNLVKLCVGSPLRQRRGQNYPPTPAYTSEEAKDIARVLSYILVDGFSYEKLSPAPIPKLKLTFLICSVGFTGPMLFDEKRYAYHLMLYQFVKEGGLKAFFQMFEWALSPTYEKNNSSSGKNKKNKNKNKVCDSEASFHQKFPDGTGEFLDAWLMLLEKMVNPKAILESPHVINPSSTQSQSQSTITNVPTSRPQRTTAVVNETTSSTLTSMTNLQYNASSSDTQQNKRKKFVKSKIFEFDPVLYLVTIHRLAFDAVIKIWGMKPLQIYGIRMTESMMSILKHIIKGEKIIKEKYKKRISEIREASRLAKMHSNNDCSNTLIVGNNGGGNSDTFASHLQNVSTMSTQTGSTNSGTAGIVLDPVFNRIRSQQIENNSDQHNTSNIVINQDHLRQLMDMGFSEEHATTALLLTVSVQDATEYLLNHPPSPPTLPFQATSQQEQTQQIGDQDDSVQNQQQSVQRSVSEDRRQSEVSIEPMDVSDQESPKITNEYNFQESNNSELTTATTAKREKSKSETEDKQNKTNKRKRNNIKRKYQITTDPPLKESRIDEFCDTAIEKTIFLMDELPGTVSKGTDLLVILYRRNRNEWRQYFLLKIVKELNAWIDFIRKQIRLGDNNICVMLYGEGAQKFYVRLQLCCLLMDDIYPDMRESICYTINKEHTLSKLLCLLSEIEELLRIKTTELRAEYRRKTLLALSVIVIGDDDDENQHHSSKKDVKMLKPKWLAQMITFIDLVEKVNLSLQRKQNMLNVTTRTWKWYDINLGRWNIYSAANNKVIDQAYENGEASVPITSGRQRYTINFNCMSQVNDESGNHRPVILSLKAVEKFLHPQQQSQQNLQNPTSAPSQPATASLAASQTQSSTSSQPFTTTSATIPSRRFSSQINTANSNSATVTASTSGASTSAAVNSRSSGLPLIVSSDECDESDSDCNDCDESNSEGNDCNESDESDSDAQNYGSSNDEIIYSKLYDLKITAPCAEGIMDDNTPPLPGRERIHDPSNINNQQQSNPNTQNQYETTDPSEIKINNSPVGLFQYDTEEIVSCLVRLLQPEIDVGIDTFLAIMKLCVRLTKNFNNAKVFAQQGGVRLLLGMRQTCGYMGFPIFATLLIRHVLEEPKTLALAMEKVIAARTMPTIPPGYRDLLFLLRQMSSAVSRDPEIFREVAQKMLRIDLLSPRLVKPDDSRLLVKSILPSASQMNSSGNCSSSSGACTSSATSSGQAPSTSGTSVNQQHNSNKRSNINNEQPYMMEPVSVEAVHDLLKALVQPVNHDSKYKLKNQSNESVLQPASYNLPLNSIGGRFMQNRTRVLSTSQNLSPPASLSTFSNSNPTSYSNQMCPQNSNSQQFQQHEPQTQEISHQSEQSYFEQIQDQQQPNAPAQSQIPQQQPQQSDKPCSAVHNCNEQCRFWHMPPSSQTDKPLLPRATILKFLADAVRSYQTFAPLIVEHQYSPEDSVLIKTPQTVLSFILDKFLPLNEHTVDREVSSMSRILIAALASCSDQVNVQTIVVCEVKSAINHVLSQPESTDKHLHLQILVGLIPTMIENCPPENNTLLKLHQMQPRRNEIFYIMVRKGLISDLAKLTQYLDLSSPHTIGTINATLKPLETLLRMTNAPGPISFFPKKPFNRRIFYNNDDHHHHGVGGSSNLISEDINDVHSGSRSVANNSGGIGSSHHHHHHHHHHHILSNQNDIIGENVEELRVAAENLVRPPERGQAHLDDIMDQLLEHASNIENDPAQMVSANHNPATVRRVMHEFFDESSTESGDSDSNGSDNDEREIDEDDDNEEEAEDRSEIDVDEETRQFIEIYDHVYNRHLSPGGSGNTTDQPNQEEIRNEVMESNSSDAIVDNETITQEASRHIESTSGTSSIAPIQNSSSARIESEPIEDGNDSTSSEPLFYGRMQRSSSENADLGTTAAVNIDDFDDILSVDSSDIGTQQANDASMRQRFNSRHPEAVAESVVADVVANVVAAMENSSGMDATNSGGGVGSVEGSNRSLISLQGSGGSHSSQLSPNIRRRRRRPIQFSFAINSPLAPVSDFLNLRRRRYTILNENVDHTPIILQQLLGPSSSGNSHSSGSGGNSANASNVGRSISISAAVGNNDSNGVVNGGQSSPNGGLLSQFNLNPFSTEGTNESINNQSNNDTGNIENGMRRNSNSSTSNIFRDATRVVLMDNAFGIFPDEHFPDDRSIDLVDQAGYLFGQSLAATLASTPTALHWWLEESKNLGLESQSDVCLTVGHQLIPTLEEQRELELAKLRNKKKRKEESKSSSSTTVIPSTSDTRAENISGSASTSFVTPSNDTFQNTSQSGSSAIYSNQSQRILLQPEFDSLINVSRFGGNPNFSSQTMDVQQGQILTSDRVGSQTNSVNFDDETTNSEIFPTPSPLLRPHCRSSNLNIAAEARTTSNTNFRISTDVNSVGGNQRSRRNRVWMLSRAGRRERVLSDSSGIGYLENSPATPRVGHVASLRQEESRLQQDPLLTEEVLESDLDMPVLSPFNGDERQRLTEVHLEMPRLVPMSGYQDGEDDEIEADDDVEIVEDIADEQDDEEEEEQEEEDEDEVDETDAEDEEDEAEERNTNNHEIHVVHNSASETEESSEIEVVPGEGPAERNILQSAQNTTGDSETTPPFTNSNTLQNNESVGNNANINIVNHVQTEGTGENNLDDLDEILEIIDRSRETENISTNEMRHPTGRSFVHTPSEITQNPSSSGRETEILNDPNAETISISDNSSSINENTKQENEETNIINIEDSPPSSACDTSVTSTTVVSVASISGASNSAENNLSATASLGLGTEKIVDANIDETITSINEEISAVLNPVLPNSGSNVSASISNITSNTGITDNLNLPGADETTASLIITNEAAASSLNIDGATASSNNQAEMSAEVREALGDLEVPEGVDPSFLAALPQEMREEVIAEHLRLQRLRQRAQQISIQVEHAAVAEVNPEFLAALPPNIQEEVLAQQRIEQQRQAAATANPNDPVDAAAFFHNLPANLRQAILTDMEDSQISVLPPELAAEAQTLRRDWENRNRQIMHERLINQIGSNSPSTSNVLNLYRRSGNVLTYLGPRFPFMHNVRFTQNWQTSGENRINIHHHSSGSGITVNNSQSGISDSNSSSPSLMTIMERQGKPLLDHEALASLLILLFIDDPKFNTLRLHRVIRNLCCHVPTREWVINALLSVIVKTNESYYIGTLLKEKSQVKPNWLNIRSDAALGSRANVFMIEDSKLYNELFSVKSLSGKKRFTEWLIATQENSTINEALIMFQNSRKNCNLNRKKVETIDQVKFEIDRFEIGIHPQAAQIVCKHAIELLITLAKSFPKNFLPYRKQDSNPNLPNVSQQSQQQQPTQLQQPQQSSQLLSNSVPQQQSQQSLQCHSKPMKLMIINKNNITLANPTGNVNFNLYEPKVPNELKYKRVIRSNAYLALTSINIETDFWDIVLNLDRNKPFKKPPSYAFLTNNQNQMFPSSSSQTISQRNYITSASSSKQNQQQFVQKERGNMNLTFDQSPFGALVSMLSYRIINKSSHLTDKLLRLLSFISVVLPDAHTSQQQPQLQPPPSTQQQQQPQQQAQPPITQAQSQVPTQPQANQDDSQQQQEQQVPQNEPEQERLEPSNVQAPPQQKDFQTDQLDKIHQCSTVNVPTETFQILHKNCIYHNNFNNSYKANIKRECLHTYVMLHSHVKESAGVQKQNLPHLPLLPPYNTDDLYDTFLPKPERLALIIETLVDKNCSEEGLEDATLLLLNLSQCCRDTRAIIFRLLVDAANILGRRVEQQIRCLLDDLREMNLSQLQNNQQTQHRVLNPMSSTSSSCETSPDQENVNSVSNYQAIPSTSSGITSVASKPKGMLQDRFTRETVVITAPTRMKQSTELQLASMIPLISKTSAQAIFLRFLKTIIQIRENVIDEHNKIIENITKERQNLQAHLSNIHPQPNSSEQSSQSNPSQQFNQQNQQQQDQQHQCSSKVRYKTVIELVNPYAYEMSSLSELLLLDKLWDTLSNCLIELELSADYHAVLVLQSAVEAFFLVHATPQKKTRQNSEDESRPNITTQNSYSNQQQSVSQESQQQQDQQQHSSQPSESQPQLPPQPQQQTLNNQQSLPRTSVQPMETDEFEVHHTYHYKLTVDQRKFLQFAEKHRTVLNQILRQSTCHLSDGPFAVLVDHTRILDFDVKRRYFRTELERLDEGIRREEIAVHVNRKTVFEDSFRELYRRNAEEWKNRFYIVFEDEEGQDAGGLLREWYVIISREIFNPMYALFTVSPGDRVTYMINSSSHANPNHLCYYKFVGRVIAKAIYDNKLLECYFTRSFYKHILGIQVKYTDMESEDYEFYKSLIFLLEHEVSALGYDLTFSLEVQEFGVTEVKDLIPNGRNVFVTDDNKLEYIRLVCQLKMSNSIKQQLNAFLEGFYDIIPKRLISIFNEQELELLISGLPNVDIEDLRANTEYHKYQTNSIQIQWFWRALRSFDQAERAKFLQFVTGTSKVPLNGFGSLEGMNGIQKFQIHRDDRSTDRLPSAHTCFNQLDLPVYKTYDKLRSSLLKAIHECSEGFGFA